jgi:hypothetical protein
LQRACSWRLKLPPTPTWPASSVPGPTFPRTSAPPCWRWWGPPVESDTD